MPKPKGSITVKLPDVYVFRNFDLKKIKVGNGIDLHALRIEDVNKVGRIGDQLDPKKVGLLFRLPYPDEDRVYPIPLHTSPTPVPYRPE